MSSSEQTCRLAIVLGNMQQKRLLRLKQVEALKTNQQALGLLADFISAGSQDLEVLEKRILELTDKSKSNDGKIHSKQNGYPNDTSKTNNISNKNSTEFQDNNKKKSGSIDEISDENEQNQNIYSITPSKFSNASKLHSLSHIEQFFTYDQADLQKVSSQVNLSGGKQQTYQYLRSLHSSGDLQQSEEEFEKMCEEMLVRLLNPDEAELKGIYEEIGKLLTAKKSAIKDKVQGATVSLLKASVLNCDIFHIVRQTKEILSQLFCICDFEVARYHEAQITTFSSRTVAQQTGV